MSEHLGMCDKRQYEHNGPHHLIAESGQNIPPFPCVNWHPIAPPAVGKKTLCVHCKREIGDHFWPGRGYYCTADRRGTKFEAPPPSEGAELPPLDITREDSMKAGEEMESLHNNGKTMLANYANTLNHKACRERQLLAFITREAQALAERDVALEKVANRKRWLDEHSKKIDALDAENDTLRNSLSAAQREIEALNSEKRTVQVMLSDAYNNVVDLQAKIERLKGGSE